MLCLQCMTGSRVVLFHLHILHGWLQVSVLPSSVAQGIWLGIPSMCAILNSWEASVVVLANTMLITVDCS